MKSPGALPPGPNGIGIGIAGRFRVGVSACNGSMTVEFALILPLLLVLVFGVIEFGRVMWIRSSLQSAVEAAARCYALDLPACDTPDKVKDYAAASAVGVQVVSSVFTPTTETCGRGVTALYSFTSIVPLIPLNGTIQARACRPIP